MTDAYCGPKIINEMPIASWHSKIVTMTLDKIRNIQMADFSDINDAGTAIEYFQCY